MRNVLITNVKHYVGPGALPILLREKMLPYVTIRALKIVKYRVLLKGNILVPLRLGLKRRNR